MQCSVREGRSPLRTRPSGVSGCVELVFYARSSDTNRPAFHCHRARLPGADRVTVSSTASLPGRALQADVIRPPRRAEPGSHSSSILPRPAPNAVNTRTMLLVRGAGPGAALRRLSPAADPALTHPLRCPQKGCPHNLLHAGGKQRAAALFKGLARGGRRTHRRPLCAAATRPARRTGARSQHRSGRFV